ncbi:MAG: site-specific DNA-methyltransferase [Acidobacteriaceae bacterium]
MSRATQQKSLLLPLGDDRPEPESIEVRSAARVSFKLPLNDNTPDALRVYREANAHFRTVPWPAPYDRTVHRLHLGDARELSWIADESVHLVVTSPPYWTLKEYAVGNSSQMGDIEDYERFLSELDRVWAECARVLVPGGRICCVVGDVCVPRRKHGRHYVMPLHSDIQVRSRRFGLDCLTPILWQKIANGAREAEGNGAGFYGKPYQPGSIVKNDTEYILMLRKGGQYRSIQPTQKALSMLTKDEMRSWLRSCWTDVPGASTTRSKHPAPYPVEVAERLIRLFSFAGDTVLDPFLGTGSTATAAIRSGRNSIGVEIEPKYFKDARRNIEAVAAVRAMAGPVYSEVIVD